MYVIGFHAVINMFHHQSRHRMFCDLLDE